MKKILISALIFSSLLSCNSNFKNLEGNWYTCTSNNEYFEFFTKKDSFKVISNVGIITNWTHYYVKSDTMYFIKPNGFDTDSTKAFLNYKYGKSLKMDFFDGNESLHFKPLNLVLVNSEMDSITFHEINTRAKSVECLYYDNN